MKRYIVTVMAILMGVVGISTSPAEASGWIYPQHYWTTNSSNVHVWGRSYAHDFACGLKDCATGSSLKAQAGKLSGTGTPAASRVNAAITFGGVGIEVGVSFPAGVSAGFVDGGSNCNHGWWDAPGSWVSVDFGSGTICESSTWGWVSNMSMAATGGVRFGGTWSARTGSANISLGGL